MNRRVRAPAHFPPSVQLFAAEDAVKSKSWSAFMIQT
jgi:hypothetical protein